MKTATIDEIAKKLEQLQHLDPSKVAAVDVIVSFALREEKGAAAVERGVRGRLLSRLQAVHDCAQPDGGRFEQLPAHGRFRSWRCSGCGLIVTDDDIAPKAGA